MGLVRGHKEMWFLWVTDGLRHHDGKRGRGLPGRASLQRGTSETQTPSPPSLGLHGELLGLDRSTPAVLTPAAREKEEKKKKEKSPHAKIQFFVRKAPQLQNYKCLPAQQTFASTFLIFRHNIPAKTWEKNSELSTESRYFSWKYSFSQIPRFLLKVSFSGKCWRALLLAQL